MRRHDSIGVGELCCACIQRSATGVFLGSASAAYALLWKLDGNAVGRVHWNQYEEFSWFQHRVFHLISASCTTLTGWGGNRRHTSSSYVPPNIFSLHGYVAVCLNTLGIRPGCAPNDTHRTADKHTSNQPVQLQTNPSSMTSLEALLHGVIYASTGEAGSLRPATVQDTAKLLRVKFSQERARYIKEMSMLRCALDNARLK